jgi:uncharacterized protein (UPF0212 family)
MAPDSAALLNAWEQGLRMRLPQSALLVLAASRPDMPVAELASLPLGARDALLFEVREQLFGSELATVSTCPHCDERLEAGFSLAAIRVLPTKADDGAVGVVRVMEAGGTRIRFRLPATLDVLAIPAGADAETARDILIDRCVIEALDAAGNAVAPLALPAAVIPAISAEMARADPQAIVDLALECPACGHAFAAAFDIASYLMAELHGWAQRLIADVAALARAFGWREADVLALSPERRKLYLDLVAR